MSWPGGPTARCGPGVITVAASSVTRHGGSSPPEQVPGLTGITRVTANYASFAVRSDGALFSWGANDDGALGNGTLRRVRGTPARVPGLTGVTQVDSNNGATLAVTSSAGTVWAWGRNNSGSSATAPPPAGSPGTALPGRRHSGRRRHLRGQRGGPVRRHAADLGRERLRQPGPGNRRRFHRYPGAGAAPGPGQPGRVRRRIRSRLRPRRRLARGLHRARSGR